MTALACYNLDTRLSRFAASVTLDQSQAPIDVIAFDPPDDLARSISVSLVSHAPGLACPGDIGWRQGNDLVEALTVRTGERLVLGIRREAVMRAVAAFRARGQVDGDATLEIAFTTIVDTPQGPRASPRRIVQVAVVASASEPDWQIEATDIDLDTVSTGKLLAIGSLSLAIPGDIVLEPRRGVSIELGCAGLDPLALTLAVASPADPSVSLRRYPDTGTGGCRHLLWLADAAALAGQIVRLEIALDRDAVLDFVEQSAQANRMAALRLRLTTRLGGWLGQNGAEAETGGAAKAWRSGLETRTVAVSSRQDGEVLVSIAGHQLACPLGGAAPHPRLSPGLSAEVDPDDESGVVRCRDIVVEVRRWPLTRSAALVIEVLARTGDGIIAEPLQRLIHDIVRQGDVGRRGDVTIPLAALSKALSDRVRAVGPQALDHPIDIDVVVSSQDEPGRPVLNATLPLLYERRVHRLPICIDLGASAISIWSGPARPEDRRMEIHQLALGAWLARHVDPHHDETGGLADADGALIPSHIGLESDNHLRADHAAHTLPDLRLVGSDRASVARRLAAFGRRYDVSVPAPPTTGIASRQRRITGLKAALTSGTVAMTLDETVYRMDATNGRVVPTQTVEVAPLVADVLDELIDLYVLRLGADRLRLDDTSPAPVVPRILIGRPSGIGGEIEARYGAALALFTQRLERLFPGSARHTDVATTVPEAVAALRYFASQEKVRDAVPEGREALLVTLDIGGSGSDVAIARLSREGGRVEAVTLATFGLAIGGDQIDEALVGVAAGLIDATMARQSGNWHAAFPDASLATACGRRDSAARAARDWLVRSVRRAKIALAARLYAQAEAGGSAYRWDDGTDGATLDVVLAERDRDGGIEGLYVPGGEPIVMPGGDPGCTLVLEPPDEAGTRRLVLRLSRAAIESAPGPHANRLTEIAAVIGELLPRMARAAAPNPAQRPEVMLTSSGRAALWPPLFEAIAREAQDSHARLPFTRPLSPASMKKAVIAGAAIMGMEGQGVGTVIQRNPLAIAAMSVRMQDLGAGGLRTEFSAERIHYLGYDMASGDRRQAGQDVEAPSLGARVDLGRRFQFVRTVPGLDPQGRMLARLRPLLAGNDPLLLLEGDAVVDAVREGLDLFGPCTILNTAQSPVQRTVTITSADDGWEGCWKIEHDRVQRVY